MSSPPYLSRCAAVTRVSDFRIGMAGLSVWLVYGMLGLVGIVISSLTTTSARASGFGTPENQWPGIWFVCEFAQRQRAPDDACQMFDDEGFQLADGQLSYLRITQSDETACRGDKKGQCFRRDRPEITITKTNRGRLTLRENQFDVKFLGCTQTFYFADTEHYREMWPDDDRCFWASKRRFYIAPFNGIYSFAK